MNPTKPRICAEFLPLDLGHVGMTPGIAAGIDKDGYSHRDVVASVRRHEAGDWGDVGPDDWEANDASVVNGSRVLSSYKLGGRKVWIITEARDDGSNRRSTLVLWPDEY